MYWLSDQYIQDVQGIQSIPVGQAITLRYFTQIFCKADLSALTLWSCNLLSLRFAYDPGVWFTEKSANHLGVLFRVLSTVTFINLVVTFCVNKKDSMWFKRTFHVITEFSDTARLPGPRLKEKEKGSWKRGWTEHSVLILRACFSSQTSRLCSPPFSCTLYHVFIIIIIMFFWVGFFALQMLSFGRTVPLARRNFYTFVFLVCTIQ